MRVTRKGQVTIPLQVRRALGIHAGSDVHVQIEQSGVRLVVDKERAPGRSIGCGEPGAAR
jgi:AbrB family looped-hinge helix DNA binding protein